MIEELEDYRLSVRLLVEKFVELHENLTSYEIAREHVYLNEYYVLSLDDIITNLERGADKTIFDWYEKISHGEKFYNYESYLKGYRNEN